MLSGAPINRAATRWRCLQAAQRQDMTAVTAEPTCQTSTDLDHYTCTLVHTHTHTHTHSCTRKETYLAPLRSQLAHAHHGLYIIAVDVEDGRIHGLGHVCAVGRGAALLGVCGEGHLRWRESDIEVRGGAGLWCRPRRPSVGSAVKASRVSKKATPMANAEDSGKKRLFQ
eukprot:scaffold126977_cov22-Tisochrysis_lutea.AAC.3